jgi:hypothetical protein
MRKHNSGIFVSSCNYLRTKAWEALGDGNTAPRVLNFLTTCRWISNYTLQRSVIRAVFRWVSRYRCGGSRNSISSELISKFRLFQKVNTVLSKRSIPTSCTTEGKVVGFPAGARNIDLPPNLLNRFWCIHRLLFHGFPGRFAQAKSEL